MIKFSEVENDVLSKGEPVFLTKTAMVLWRCLVRSNMKS